MMYHMVHWDKWDEMDKRDNARVWNSPMLYHLVAFGTLGGKLDSASVWDSPMVYQLIPCGILGRDGKMSMRQSNITILSDGTVEWDGAEAGVVATEWD